MRKQFEKKKKKKKIKKAKLPKLVIWKTEWFRFWNQFETEIEQQDHINPSKKILSEGVFIIPCLYVS